MDEMNKLPEEQDTTTFEKVNVSKSASTHDVKMPTPKAPIPKLLFIIGGAIASVAAIVVAVVLIIGGGKHEHSFGDWNIVDEPTCLAAGIEERNCDCGEKEMRRIDALGHTEIIDKEVEPTCTSSGLTEGKHCSKCNMVIVAQSIIAQLSHKYSSDSDIDCNYCGEIRDDNCPHSEITTIWGKDATCTETGITDGKKCINCGRTIVAQQKIPIKAHTEEIISAVESTCTETGLTEGKKCSVCGKTLVSQQEISKADHTYDNKYDETCNKCGFVREAECAHIESVTIVGYAATCDVDGLTDGTKCKKCGIILEKQQTITALGHQYNDDDIVSQATCTTQGIKKYTCTVSNCNHSYTDTYSLPTYTATEISNQAIMYVGEITTYDRSGYALATGTGFVISSDGKIITNYHVIEGAYYADIIINNTEYTISSVLAYDANIDLAILKINATGLTAATICKQPVNVGETVYAVGSSRGLTNTFSQGIVTYADRVVDGVSHVQHDASITHGNSGGPLINVYGEVIGINTWGISDSQNLNFAVATTELDNIVYTGTPMSLSEFYELNNNPYDLLFDWLLYNYNAESETQIRFDYYGDSTWYSLAYETEDNYLYIDVIWEFDDGAEMYLLIDFSGDPSNYFYYASYVDDGYTNDTCGYINATTFTENTSLSYTSYEGTHWNKEILLQLYQSGIVDLLAWFDWATVNYNMGVTTGELGFTAWGN